MRWLVLLLISSGCYTLPAGDDAGYNTSYQYADLGTQYVGPDFSYGGHLDTYDLSLPPVCVIYDNTCIENPAIETSYYYSGLVGEVLCVNNNGSCVRGCWYENQTNGDGGVTPVIAAYQCPNGEVCTASPYLNAIYSDGYLLTGYCQ